MRSPRRKLACLSIVGMQLLGPIAAPSAQQPLDAMACLAALADLVVQAEPATIEPRSGVGGCTPRPRKDSDEAIRMTKPRSSVILVRIDGTQLGRISRNMTCAREAPITSAAST